MLQSTTERSVVLTEMVEHPGGHDGGEFLQTHEYGISASGVYYSTGTPDCPTDVFDEEDDPEEYTWSDTKDEAITVLRGELAAAEQSVIDIRKVLEAFEEADKFTIYFDDEEI